MEANRIYSSEIGVYSRWGTSMENNKVVILNIEGYKLFSIVYHMSQQKSRVFCVGAKTEKNKTYST